jgi:hypothetical protein
MRSKLQAQRPSRESLSLPRTSPKFPAPANRSLKINPFVTNPQTLAVRPARLPRVATHNVCADAVAAVDAVVEAEAESKQLRRLSLLPLRKALPPACLAARREFRTRVRRKRERRMRPRSRPKLKLFP